MAKRKKKKDWKKFLLREGMIILGCLLIAGVVYLFLEYSYKPEFPGLPGEMPKASAYDVAEAFNSALDSYYNKKREYEEYLSQDKYLGTIYKVVTIVPYPILLTIRIVRMLKKDKKPKKRKRKPRKK